MLQAWISSPRGSLYFAAEANPYNLEHLRAHVRALHRAGGPGTCLALNLGGEKDGQARADVAVLAKELTCEGVQVRFSAPVEEPSHSSTDVAEPDVHAPKRGIAGTWSRARKTDNG